MYTPNGIITALFTFTAAIVEFWVVASKLITPLCTLFIIFPARLATATPLFNLSRYPARVFVHTALDNAVLADALLLIVASRLSSFAALVLVCYMICQGAQQAIDFCKQAGA